MPAIAFHTGLADKVGYACRLLRKAARQGTPVVVCGSAETLSIVDKALWVFDPQEFVPHVWLRSGRPVPSTAGRTPIWLVDDCRQADRHGVLLNLGDDVPDGHEAFERVIEIVDRSDADRLAARRRWRVYETRGHAITHHRQEGEP